MSEMIYAPWTPEQVESLNGFQNAGIVHPFTCGKEDCRQVLLATPDGWICPDCGYHQTWAHDYMANGAWKELADEYNKFLESKGLKCHE